MAHAVASLEKALAAGERFVYISNHPAAISFRRAISDFCRLICTECKRDNDTGYQAGPQNKKVPFLFVGGCHKSGTTLLRNLLDGHTDLFTFPGDGFGIRFAESVVKRKPSEHLPYLVQGALSCASMPIAGERPFWILGGEAQTYLDMARAIDRRILHERSAPKLLEALLFGFAESSSRERQPCYVVEKSTFNVEDAIALARLYPDARFLQIVRHPGAVVAAQKRKQLRKGRDYNFRRECEALARSLAAGIRGRKTLGYGRWYLVRFEDLLANTRDCMAGVSQWLGLEYQDTLARPTVFSQPAGSNTSRISAKPSDGHMSEGAGDLWREELTVTEISIVKSLFGKSISYYGYPDERTSFYPPLKAFTKEVRDRGAFSRRSETLLWVRLWLKTQAVSFPKLG